jgi:hypothetical protein
MKPIETRLTIIAAVLLAAGCAAIPEDTASPELRDKLTSIDTVDLVALSETEPISVEEATEQMTDRIADPNLPVPEVKLTLEQVRAAALANNLTSRRNSSARPSPRPRSTSNAPSSRPLSSPRPTSRAASRQVPVSRPTRPVTTSASRNRCPPEAPSP